MNICDMKMGERGQVLSVELEEEVVQRLRYLGVAPNAEILILKVSLFKKTYLVQAGSAKIAIGREVAQKIIVCRK